MTQLEAYDPPDGEPYEIQKLIDLMKEQERLRAAEAFADLIHNQVVPDDRLGV